jgi:hypothetical protein
MRIPFERLDWGERYGPSIEKGLNVPFRSAEYSMLLKRLFAARLKRILQKERATYDPMQLASIIATRFPHFRDILRKVQWECLINKFSNSKTWSRDRTLLNDHSLNIRFEELLNMTNDQTTDWVDLLRVRILKAWNESGSPPFPEVTLSAMIEDFRKMSKTRLTPRLNDYEDTFNVLVDDGRLGSCLKLFFPMMLKARINYSSKINGNGNFDGHSVYDLFADDKLRALMQKGCRRHFRRDSFYKYSQSVVANGPTGLGVTTGKEWITAFPNTTLAADHAYWISPKPHDDAFGTGYTQIDASDFLSLSRAELSALHEAKAIPDGALTNLAASPSRSTTALPMNHRYNIRLYKRSMRLFPSGFNAFKIGYNQVAANFSPVIAKYLYEKYTEEIKEQKVINVYDPCAGWGGRIAGAMMVKHDRHIHYIGTDPNTGNYSEELGTTRYEHVAWFINQALETWGIYDANAFAPHTCDIYRMGSETIGSDSNFKKYRGKLDLVLSSPPYFSREIYSEDETQSVKKFPRYDQWRDGFLRPTLETAYGYLRRNRYLLWNVADIWAGDGFCPIEQDSLDILQSLGAQLVGIERMVLANAPGSHRVDGDGIPTTINAVRIDGTWRKFEPIYVLRKP